MKKRRSHVTVERQSIDRALENALDALSVGHELLTMYIAGGAVNIDQVERYFFNLQCLSDDLNGIREDGFETETFTELLRSAYGGLEIIESTTGTESGE